MWGHITTVPACSSGTLTNVLPHRNAMPQTQDTTPHPVTVYRHGANLSLCYPSMWNVTLEYTATHFNVLGETRPGNPSPTFHTHQRTFNLMLSWWSTVGSSVESTVPTGSWTRDLWCANPVRYPLAHSDFQCDLSILLLVRHLILLRYLCVTAMSHICGFNYVTWMWPQYEINNKSCKWSQIAEPYVILQWCHMCDVKNVTWIWPQYDISEKLRVWSHIAEPSVS